jgi:hypothetical protein
VSMRPAAVFFAPRKSKLACTPPGGASLRHFRARNQRFCARNQRTNRQCGEKPRRRKGLRTTHTCRMMLQKCRMVCTRRPRANSRPPLKNRRKFPNSCQPGLRRIGEPAFAIAPEKNGRPGKLPRDGPSAEPAPNTVGITSLIQEFFARCSGRPWWSVSRAKRAASGGPWGGRARGFGVFPGPAALANVPTI